MPHLGELESPTATSAYRDTVGLGVSKPNRDTILHLRIGCENFSNFCVNSLENYGGRGAGGGEVFDEY